MGSKWFNLAVTVVLLGWGAQAQIPTIDLSSLNQLIQQYQTMQNQLSTAQQIVSTSTGILNTSQSILGMENNIYNQALGNLNTLQSTFQGWISDFTSLLNVWNQKADWFQNLALTPIQSFDNNVNYWANQIGGQKVADLQSCWKSAIGNVGSGIATDWEKSLALAGYNSHLVDNARTSREFGTSVLAAGENVLQQSKAGTLIQQAAAQNTLLYQQTALLDKMKNDINDATVAEAAERDAKMKAEKDASDQQDALNHASSGP